MANNRPHPALWGTIILFSLLTGYLLVQYLVVPPLKMVLSAILCLASFCLLIFFFIRFFIMRRGTSPLTLVAAVILSLVAFITGYGFTTYQFLNQGGHGSLPAIDPSINREGGHSAVIYLTHGEPPGYSPMSWLETFRELDADGAPFIPAPFRPFFFNGLRDKYLTSGGSPHNIVHQTMMRGVEELFRAEGDETTRFYIAFLDSDPIIATALAQAVNEGASKVAISNVFLTESSHTLSGKEQVNELKLEEYGVDVCSAGPLWDSLSLKQMFVERANKALRSGGSMPVDKYNVGILLVGHGQPETWNEIYPTQTSQETQFRQDIVDMLIADGFKADNISLAWMEFQKPAVAEVAAEMAAHGVKTLLVFSASISAPSIHSEYDVPAEVERAKLPDDIQVINLGAWGYDPLVLQAIREKLKGCGL